MDESVNKITEKLIANYIKDKLTHDAKWQLKALIRIYEFQTSDEKLFENTTVHNKVGFSGIDGEIMTSMAKQYLRKGYLSPKQMAVVTKRIPHYWMQIQKLSDRNKILKCACVDGWITEEDLFLNSL